MKRRTAYDQACGYVEIPSRNGKGNEGISEYQLVIPQIREQQVGVNCVDGNYDAVLISLFDSLADLETYKKDPRHVAVSALCKAIRTDRVAVDFEV